MGFDIVAVKPKNDHAYFRNNVWWWRPLWQYCRMCDLITEKQFERGNYNDGHTISKEQAEQMAIRLIHMVEQESTKKYAEEYNAWRNALPKDDWNRHYPFTVENVENFARFCLNSGGFEIC